MEAVSYKFMIAASRTVNYVLGEFYWEVNVGETVNAADYIAPPDMLSREVNQNPSELKKTPASKRDKKNREINYTVNRYVPVEEIEKAFGVNDLESRVPSPPISRTPIKRSTNTGV